MIRVLQDWREIGAATLALQRAGLPTHETPQKNWDQYLVWQLVTPLDRAARIVDLGCGEGFTLKLLTRLGFTNLCGIDYQISNTLRLRQLRWAWRHHGRVPYRLRRGDLTRTPLPDASQDVALCISTIEHGVDTERFFAEARRLLKPGGRLLVTTDYWAEPLPTEGSARAFGLPWRVFSRGEAADLIEQARRAGLVLADEGTIPPCGEQTVSWHGWDYTFLALVFVRPLE